MTAPAFVELPYDRGHQWHLVVGNETAVISEQTALVLIGRFGVPESSGQLRQETMKGIAENIGQDYRLSKKAKALLTAAGVEIGGSK